MTTVAEARRDMHKRMEGERSLTTPEGIRELVTVGKITTRLPHGFHPGREVRVSVKAAGDSEPAVDVRQYVVPADDVRAKGYDGPDRKGGVWLSVFEAETLCGLLADAVIAAETEIQRRHDMRDVQPVSDAEAVAARTRWATDEIGRGTR